MRYQPHRVSRTQRGSHYAGRRGAGRRDKDLEAWSLLGSFTALAELTSSQLPLTSSLYKLVQLRKEVVAAQARGQAQAAATTLARL
jgi:hypothetical protein